MTSAMDENGNRILKSKAGDVIVEKVLMVEKNVLVKQYL